MMKSVMQFFTYFKLMAVVFGGSQAVRPPKEYRFVGTELGVRHFGNGVLLLPVDDPWQMLAAGLAAFGPTGPADDQQPCLLRKQARALSDEAVASLRRLCALSMALLAPAVFIERDRVSGK